MEQEEKKMIFLASLMPLIKYLNENEIHDKILTKEEFINILSSFGTKQYPHQLIDCPFSHSKNTITLAIENSDYISAAVLTAISLEEDINSFIRIICYSKGYSHDKITNFITELGIKSKIDFILPILGCNLSEQYKNLVYEFFPLRNKIVHGKAIPNHYTCDYEKGSSIDENKKKAKQLISSYPIDKIYKYSDEINQSIINDIPEINRAVELFKKYNYI